MDRVQACWFHNAKVNIGRGGQGTKTSRVNQKPKPVFHTEQEESWPSKQTYAVLQQNRSMTVTTRHGLQGTPPSDLCDTR